MTIRSLDNNSKISIGLLFAMGGVLMFVMNLYADNKVYGSKISQHDNDIVSMQKDIRAARDNSQAILLKLDSMEKTIIQNRGK